MATVTETEEEQEIISLNNKLEEYMSMLGGMDIHGLDSEATRLDRIRTLERENADLKRELAEMTQEISILRMDRKELREKLREMNNNMESKLKPHIQRYGDLLYGNRNSLRSVVSSLVRSEYQVTLYTGDVLNAGTSANVHITILGQTDSAEQQLGNQGDRFLRGGKDVFNIHCGHLGQLQRVTIGHDNSGVAPGWYLDKVTVLCIKTNDEYTFKCQRWIYEEPEDLTDCTLRRGKDPSTPTERTVEEEVQAEVEEVVCQSRLVQKEAGIPKRLPLKPPPAPGPESYELTVHTGDKDYAGTDANVYVTFIGEQGESKEHKLDNEKNNFERGQQEKFTIQCPNVGPLKTLRVRHDDSGVASAWFLEGIIVKDVAQGQLYTFPCQRWLDKDQGDQKICRELTGEPLPPEVEYEITVYTGDKDGAGTDANVYVTLCGDGDQSKEHKLDRLLENNFERGRQDKFTFVYPSLGKLHNLIIRHDNTGFNSAWLLHKVIVEDKHNEEFYEFLCDQWLDKSQGDKEISRKLAGKLLHEKDKPSPSHKLTLRTSESREPEPSNENKYEITVYTGDVKGAGTDSNVYATLYGEEGNSKEYKLDTWGNDFERGQQDKFTIRGQRLGKLRGLLIRHDNTGIKPAWFLHKVIVEDKQNEEFYEFLCDQWLDKSHGDKKTSRKLPSRLLPEKEKPLPEKRSPSHTTYRKVVTEQTQLVTSAVHKYEITVYTGDQPGAGTDSNVYITLYGQEGISRERKLDTAANNFERGQQDKFTIQCSSLGKLQRLLIRHDNRGIKPGWFLHKVVVEDIQKGELYEFPCDQWLDKNKGDRQISRELVGTVLHKRDKSPPRVPENKYEITVYTGDVKGAGTDANVYITLHGEEGSSKELELDTWGNNFEQGKQDKFLTRCHNLGKLKRIHIRHDNKGFKPAWFLNKVIVEDKQKGQFYEFLCHQWLDKGQGDNKISREIPGRLLTEKEKPLIDKKPPYHVPEREKPEPKPAAENKYEITVYTGDVKWAGTDANVYITLYGEEGTSKELELDTWGNNFEQGKQDKFLARCPNLGRLNKIHIRHDNKGFKAAWFLHKVIVEDKQTGEFYEFLCDQWLDKSQGDKKISRELIGRPLPEKEKPLPDKKPPYHVPEREKPEPKPAAENKYEITVYTGDVKWAGTDANVYITLYGEEGTSKELELDTWGNNFEQGKQDKFLARCPNLGRLNKIHIRHDNKGFKAAWFLHKVIVEDKQTGEFYEFLCDQWLDKSQGDKKISRELIGRPLPEKEKPLPDKKPPYHVPEREKPEPKPAAENKYEITVYTGDVKWAGTDANVYITLYGEEGTSKELELDTWGNNFEQGKQDKFLARCPNLGRLNKIHIRHDNKGFKAAWFLHKVIVEDKQTGEFYEFLCDQWLDKSQGDKKISRELIGRPLPEKEKPLPDKKPPYHVPEREKPEPKPAAENKYEITVYTGDVKWAGTDANVYITLYGEEGTSKELELDTWGNNFEQGKQDKFLARCPNLGRLNKIHIRHDNKGFKAAWFLHKVIVEDKQTGEFYEFLCDQWLDKSQGDKKISRELIGRPLPEKEKPLPDKKPPYHVPEREKPEPKPAAENKYVITVYTGDVKWAGTDANVYITLYGEEGTSKELELDTWGNNFEQGKRDKFLARCPKLGRLNKIHIRHDNKGFKAAWFLHKVIVEDKQTGEFYEFLCDQWLDKSQGDKKISRELIGRPLPEKEKPLPDKKPPYHVPEREKPEPKPAAENKYEITVYTGDVKWAGTDANVYITLYGEEGTSKELELDTWGNNFEQGKQDKFLARCPNLGRLDKIHIRHDNKGFKAAWFLHKVIVEDKQTGEFYEFLCDQWLDKSQGDKKISRELIGRPLPEKENPLPDKKPPYHVPEREKPEPKPAAENKYEITVYTGDVKWAGTDANVYITLYGEEGTSKELELDTWGNNFEQGKQDKFLARCPNLGRLDKIHIRHDNKGFKAAWFLHKTLDIEFYPGIKYEQEYLFELLNFKVIVEDKQTGEFYEFLCDQWLDKSQGDKKISRELIGRPLPEKEKPLPDKKPPYHVPEREKPEPKPAAENKYEITVYTGDVKWAGTDANVYITLYGEKGGSKELHLDTWGNNFEQGKQDKFLTRCPKLGRLQMIHIRHDNKGFYPAWFLHKVIVEDKQEEEFYEFLCNQWLDASQGDKKTSRELSCRLLPEKEKPLPDKKPPYYVPDEPEPKITEGYKFEITVYTGDVKGAGTDANVFIKLYGTEGNSKEFKLDTWGNNFEQGKQDKFTIQCHNLGRLKTLVVRHDDKGFKAAWFLNKIIVEDKQNGEFYEFVCNQWLDKSQGDKKISRELSGRQLTDKEKPLPDKTVPHHISGNKYEITIYTGDVKGAGTDSNVFITLYGDKGNSKEQKLDTWGNNFERGKQDKFTMQCPSLGKLQRLVIRHDNKGFGSGWFLSKVIVEDKENGELYEFLCNQWLDKNQGDKQISRELLGVILHKKEESLQQQKSPPLTREPPEPTSTEGSHLEITVYTGDVESAGTDANVYLKLFGEEGNSKEFKLDNWGNNFEQGKQDKFTVQCHNLGRLKTIVVRHDNTGVKPAWYLNKIIVEDKKTGEFYEFLCNKWLDPCQGDKKVSRELPGRVLSEKEKPVTDKKSPQQISGSKYEITVYTGNVKGAGTDANVFITLHGEKGTSKELKLDTWVNNFEQGKQDKFSVQCPSLGKLRKLLVRHDNSGFKAAWFLHKITVEDKQTGEFYEFLCDKWLDKSQGDKKIARELSGTLLPKKETTSPLGTLPRATENRYEIKVFTGDKPAAGTDANVFIIFHLDTGETKEFKLDNSKNNFERGKEDRFVIESPSLGPLTKLGIRHDNSGFRPGWFLDKVIVSDVQNEKAYEFPCRRWLDVDQDDHKIARELLRDKVVPVPPGNKYEITVNTGDKAGAGTDSNVYVTLYGENGQSQELHLDNGQNNFEQGGTDKFMVEYPNLGPLKTLRVRHDNSGFYAGWYCDKITVKPSQEDTVYEFPCHRWFATNQDDKQISRDIPVGKVVPLEPIKYGVLVYTGQEKGAGTDANVFITICGEKGESREQKLDRRLQNNFERGQEDSFTIEHSDLGPLKKLRVRHDNSGIKAGWLLDKIIIVEEKTEGKSYEFPCNRWLDVDKDDHKISRELEAKSIHEIREVAPIGRKEPHRYRITVYTGDKKHGGTDAHVYITIAGDSGITDERILDNKKNNFERGGQDTFEIMSEDLGVLKSVKIRHNNKGLFPGWFVDKITVLDDERRQLFEFPCYRWLSKHKDTGEIGRDLHAGSFGHVTIGDDGKVEIIEPLISMNPDLAQKERYKVTVYTGKKQGAGTDAKVYLRLFGDLGDSEERLLDNKKNNFEKGKQDEFTIVSQNLGGLDRLNIRHDNSGVGPGWFLDKITVLDIDRNTMYEFPCSRWLSKGDDDHQISRELQPASATAATLETENGGAYATEYRHVKETYKDGRRVREEVRTTETTHTTKTHVTSRHSSSSTKK